MSENRIRNDVLARITGNPQLTRAMPRLPPEVLHAVITRYGLQDCGALLTLATTEQLSAVFDLDLWKTDRPGAEEYFDAARFCEWLEVLVDADATLAAARLANMDVALLVTGLSPHVSVYDPAVFSAAGEPSGADAVSNAGRERGVHAEIGGYIVIARRADAWDAIVEALLALDEHQPDAFQRVMRGCRRLSDSGREIDGLDDLLSEAEQARFDLSVSREQRRDRLGFLPPQQARAFLDSARRMRLEVEPPQDHLMFAAYQRTLASASAVAGVIEVLRDAGVLGDTPRARLPAAQDERSPVNAALNHYLQSCAESGDAAWMARDQQLAFLANALVGGCSVQGRLCTPGEAMDAAAATCNLGLEYWPRHWRAASSHGLATIFQVGWRVLHREVSMVAADRLADALDNVRSSDRDLQLELHALRRELHRQRKLGTPWRARGQLDVLASLDLPAWAALTALLDECPVMLANVSAPGGRQPHAVNPSEFQFIAGARDVASVHAFLRSLIGLLSG